MQRYLKKDTRANCKTSLEHRSPVWQFLKNARLAPALPAKSEVLQSARTIIKDKPKSQNKVGKYT